jgi:phosphatidate cytidylyltransferase
MRLNMKVRMSKRTATALILLAVGFPTLFFGGIPYFLFIGFLLTVAAWEYVGMFQAAGSLCLVSRPARWLVIVAVVAVAAARFFTLTASIPVLTLSVMAMLAFHLVDYERGTDQAGLNFSVSVSALVYLGWVGSYLFDLRQLENGAWWAMFVLPCVWFADTGAYLLGAAYGKQRMSPRLSPKKTWEGFAAGVFSAMLMGGFLAFAYSTWGPLHLSIWVGVLFGLVVGLLTPLGDLGESMLKRQAGLKDSGTIFPGHGGAFDRIDSWIWGAVLGYYFITWFIL